MRLSEELRVDFIRREKEAFVMVFAEVEVSFVCGNSSSGKHFTDKLGVWNHLRFIFKIYFGLNNSQRDQFSALIKALRAIQINQLEPIRPVSIKFDADFTQLKRHWKRHTITSKLNFLPGHRKLFGGNFALLNNR